MINAIEPKEPPRAIDNPKEKHQQRGQQKRKQETPPEAATFELSHQPAHREEGGHTQPSTDGTNAPQEDDDDVGKSLDVSA